MNYEKKYIKYNQKYINIKPQIGRGIYKQDAEEIKIMSFNILVDAPIWKKYTEMKTKKENFIYWNFRKNLIIKIQ